MSSEDDTLDALPAAPVKKRRIQRACDICRQKRRPVSMSLRWFADYYEEVYVLLGE
ncbi:hypothetical protein C8F01DRAFT_1244103 [Mycena amicta]|nr:hypothetical protein C8F01DRAFT_1244103 [Mycena amicta]